ncbi:MAG: competence protein TfoX [Zetaproteobacteria bacterium CG_4_9_14_3_um_filter_49_83]|nr:MAG: competence protein TfoX [Zetaproteobacteria bacterium CG17_big_fil_post_rev_8_21_14_2_50_50_13]PIV30737.1 MAG: competence protein TfoX [Zetaproteobacteria bacterium CG02_land_8_20_14_3_00_50_9]PIY55079.1 MAG: competence protein TfoX [Zetaproteobacteria bacterium CG_4_10_14_0_8_um_filter_49_80]PJA36567.1 MAG: competence protein TfoX [Zetaproteobacteria bacterium CG_4_9_14_3_um_filter_49_83]
MFGEYCLYYDGKPVGLVCNDLLFLKPTAAGRALLTEIVEASPYPRARLHFQIDPDTWEDANRLCELVVATARELPLPKPKKPRIKK